MKLTVEQNILIDKMLDDLTLICRKNQQIQDEVRKQTIETEEPYIPKNTRKRTRKMIEKDHEYSEDTHSAKSKSNYVDNFKWIELSKISAVSEDEWSSSFESVALKINDYLDEKHEIKAIDYSDLDQIVVPPRKAITEKSFENLTEKSISIDIIQKSNNEEKLAPNAL